jgi:hypothetical protein
MRFIVYPQGTRWRWKAVTRGRIVAVSWLSYSRRRDCLRALARFARHVGRGVGFARLESAQKRTDRSRVRQNGRRVGRV